MNVLQLFPTENSARVADAKPDVPADFDAFWAIWPRRVAKRDAQRAWTRLTPAEQAAAMEAVPRHVKYWHACGREREHIPHPATWLNGARWEDEIELPQAQRSSRSQEPEPQWWASDVLMDRKGQEAGVGSARPGESREQYRARIQQAMEDKARFGKVA